jgi:hypothetical protein
MDDDIYVEIVSNNAQNAKTDGSKRKGKEI